MRQRKIEVDTQGGREGEGKKGGEEGGEARQDSEVIKVS